MTPQDGTSGSQDARIAGEGPKSLVGYALRQRCKFEMDWCLPAWRKWWLTFKCCLAILLSREDAHEYTFDDVTVAYFNWFTTSSMEFGAGQEGKVLRVPMAGLSYSVGWDGWP